MFPPGSPTQLKTHTLNAQRGRPGTKAKYLAYLPGCVGDPHMANVSTHQLGREGVFGDEEDGSSQVYVQTDTSLALRSILLHTHTGTFIYMVMK